MAARSTTEQRGQSIGLTLIRLVVGFVFVVSGAGKVLGIGPDVLPVADFAGFLAQLGIPAPGLMAWAVALIELVGGVLLIVGLGTRIVGLALAANMAVATALVHFPSGFNVGDGGYEYTLVLAVCAAALALGGPGVLSLDRFIRGSLLGSSD